MDGIIKTTRSLEHGISSTLRCSISVATILERMQKAYINRLTNTRYKAEGYRHAITSDSMTSLPGTRCRPSTEFSRSTSMNPQPTNTSPVTQTQVWRRQDILRSISSPTTSLSSSSEVTTKTSTSHRILPTTTATTRSETSITRTHVCSFSLVPTSTSRRSSSTTTEDE